MCLENTWTELIKKITVLFLLSRVTGSREQGGADVYKVESFHREGRQGRQLEPEAYGPWRMSRSLSVKG